MSHSRPCRPARLAWLAAAVATTCVALGPHLAQAAPPPVSPRLLVDEPGDQSWPRVSGNLVVWQDSPSLDLDQIEPGSNIFARDLSTGQTTQLTTSGRAARPAVSGSVVLWTEVRDADRDIFGFDFATSQPLTIVTAPGPQDYVDVSGPIVVWLDGRDRRRDIYGLDLRDPVEQPLAVGSNRRFRPRVSGQTVVWQEGRVSPGLQDIFALDLVSGQERQLTTSHSASLPAIDGDWVVYLDGYAASSFVEAVSLSSGQTRRLTAESRRRGGPAIAGPLVVWEEARGDTWDLSAYDLATGEEAVLIADPGDQTQPSTDGSTLVWTDGRGETLGIYAATLTPRGG